jgi:hypothetical protein
MNSNNNHLLFQLEQMLQWKKSKKFYAERLKITESEVDDLIQEIKNRENLMNEAEAANYIGDLEEQIVRYEEDLSRGTGEIVLNTPNEIKSLEELIEKCNIDTNKWEITKYVQNYWGNGKSPHWQVKAWMNKKTTAQVFQDSFVEFLKEYQPSSQEIMSPKIQPQKQYGCLVINKQDSHLNKYDVDGENNMEDRFAAIIEKTETIISQARLSNNLDQIKYIIGSDEFNSEWTNATTKGTPQFNTLPYQESFKMICEHEIRMITLMLQSCRELEVIYVPGNHDEYAGWHLINWLSTFFRNECRVKFDDSPKYRKYVSYGSSAMMFNHGDAIKPSKLAGIFPMEFKEEWSRHNNYYIFTGDKHHELSQDFNGIKFYQIPAFSNAKSQWDDKNGYTVSKGEVTGFLIELLDGMTNIFKQYL